MSASLSIAGDVETPVTLNLPPQSLSAALSELARQADLQILFAPELVADLDSQPLRGRYSAAEALTQLLSGSDLEFVVQPPDTIVVRARSAPQQPQTVAAANESTPTTPPATEHIQPAPETPQRTSVPEEIVVAAARVQRSGYTAPTPTIIIGAMEIERQAADNVAQVLNEIPTFKATTNPQTNGVISRTAGATYSDLRGLGASRTLVLVDGKRFVPQIAAGLPGYQVDLNQIPTLMVERAEVVTGGASAQWGSDAVAGVVNLVLKKDFEGVRGEVQMGRSRAGDNRSERAALLAGTTFAAGRGHLTLAIDHSSNDGVGDVYTRDWGRKGYSLVANPAADEWPINFILPDVQFSSYTPGGLINDTVLRGIQFDADGEPIPFEYGTLVGTINMVGGGQPGINIGAGPAIAPGVRRTTTYARGDYELTDSVTGYIEGSYADTTGGGLTLPARDTALLIRRDNAFLPQTVRQAMLDNGIDAFNLGRISYDTAWASSRIDNRTGRLVAGAEGEWRHGWRWEAYYIYGKNRYSQRVFNNRIRANYARAYDAVMNPASGAIVCRSTLTDPGDGCIPMNVFGVGAPSAQAIDYVTGTTRADTEYVQNAAAFNLTGEPFATWAGPVSIATGLEYRSERQRTEVDPISATSGYEANNSQPVAGRFNVKEFYVEAVAPLLTDVNGSESLELIGAIRQTNYSTAADEQTTWKLGVTYKPFDGLMVRAVRSRDIRAPNIYEMNVGPASVTNVISYPPFQPQIIQINSGNPELQAEFADTTTLGFAYQPHWLPELQLSLDYYRIDAQDIITTMASQQIANYCLEGQAYYCERITFDAAGVPTHILSPYVNLASVDISGLDAQLTYRLSFDTLPGSLVLNLAGNYALQAEVNANGLHVIDRVGETGPGNAYSTARFRGTAGATYDLGAAQLSAQLRHIGSGKHDATWTTGIHINDNSVPSVTYLDLGASYQATNNLQVFATVDNTLDRDPPPAPLAQGYPTNPIYFDMIGMTFRVGLRLTF